VSQNLLIEVLEANHLLRSPNEVAIFEQTLAEIAQNPDITDLPSLHLILDDACEQPEVMFSLVHFLESFEVQAQLQAFIQMLPDLVKRAAGWTAILYSRIMNDAIARSAFEERVRSMSEQEQIEIQRPLSLTAVEQASSQVPIGCLGSLSQLMKWMWWRSPILSPESILKTGRKFLPLHLI
jgi:Immunity protein 30